MAAVDCVAFLQWALPRLHMRWPGFRKVRRQVCRRIQQRTRALELPTLAAYQRYLESHEAEWRVLDQLCRITISRFLRDRSVWQALGEQVLPTLAANARKESRTALHCLSAGCASGEEPYGVALVWRLGMSLTPEVDLYILGTDADPELLERARRASYPASSLREVPETWRQRAFMRDPSGEEPDANELRDELREHIRFEQHDIREQLPPGPFDLILCRNLAFTYFDQRLQEEVLGRLVGSLRPGGALIIGKLESLPPEHGLEVWIERERVFRLNGDGPDELTKRIAELDTAPE